MSIALKPLSESVLRRLTNDALTTLLGEAAQYQLDARRGLQLTLSNEQVADLNMLVVGAGANHQHYQDLLHSCLRRDLPFLVMVFPEAGRVFDELAASLGLSYAVDFPIMVRADLDLEPSGHQAAEVSRASSEEDADANATVIASAYSMPKDSVLRVTPCSFFESPGADVYLARINGEAVGSVTLTYHGDTCGIWAMGIVEGRQRSGIGRRLLSTAIANARDRGIRRCFLGATPAGLELYKRLGFQNVCSARVWVSGVTQQS